jgi:hypothetical protein
MLYRSEMASWYGTDLFLERFKEQSGNIGGYFSYQDGNIAKCIFFSSGDKPTILATISFDSTYNTASAEVDTTRKNFTQYETELHDIRQKALAQVNSDTFFLRYKETDFNLIPIIYDGQKKVYSLTGPKNGGIVIIGNDYLLTFDENNQLASKKRLHKNIQFFNYNDTKDLNQVGGIHTHLPESGDFITSTDICTLMLFEKFAKWESHIVISQNYISIWNCKTDSLIVITREAWDKINDDQKKRNKKND